MPAMAHSPARSLDVGAVIADTYTIEGLIGRGGMGAVFVASHVRLPGKKVAIKVLHPDVADAESLARFRREAEIASRLGHPNIVEVHDWNQLPDGTPYLVLEFLAGESLAERLARGPLPLDEVIPILRQVGSALAAAHRSGVIHRDLKPANIFLIPQEEGPPRAKVLDFGISKIHGSGTVKTQDTQMLGTPQYMAPEQATGKHAEVDARTDVFALGAVLYELLTGQAVFGGATIPEVVFKVVFEPAPPIAALAPDLPPAVAQAIDRALAKKADDRWPDMASFVEAVTGAPLTTSRAPIPSAVRAAAAPLTPAKQSTNDAFAATVGSGDHGAALATAARAALARAAPTVDERPAAAATPTVTAVTAPAKRSKLPLYVGGLVIAAAAGVAGVLIAGGGGGARGPAPAPAVTVDAAGTVDAGGSGPAPDAATVVDAGDSVVDAGSVIDAAAPPDAARPTPRPDGGTTTGATPADDDPPAVRQATAAARAALAAGDPDEALRVTRAALNDHPDAQVLYALRAQAYCANDDVGGAQTALRKVSAARLRAAVKRACKAAGYDL
jgi:tRNA A-37 threonylcarbamoyl transferase component Bud32